MPQVHVYAIDQSETRVGDGPYGTSMKCGALYRTFRQNIDLDDVVIDACKFRRKQCLQSLRALVYRGLPVKIDALKVDCGLVLSCWANLFVSPN